MSFENDVGAEKKKVKEKKVGKKLYRISKARKVNAVKIIQYDFLNGKYLTNPITIKLLESQYIELRNDKAIKIKEAKNG